MEATFSQNITKQAKTALSLVYEDFSFPYICLSVYEY